jgi:spermidine synthase
MIEGPLQRTAGGVDDRPAGRISDGTGRCATMKTGSLSLIMVFLGANAMLLQVTSLREFMAVFSGNELDLGITLSFWLLAVGIGSAAAKNVRNPRALGLTVLSAGLLSQPLLSSIPFIRPLLTLERGEIVPLDVTVIATALVLTPACVLIGMQFPLAVRTFAGNATRVFLLEAGGAFLGGSAFTFLVAGHAGASSVLAAVSMVSIALGALLLRTRALALLLVVPLLVSAGFSRARSALMEGDAALISRTDSRYGTIEVLKTRGQFNIIAAGKFQFSYPDRQTDEVKAHLPFTLHPDPRRVLIAGGSPGVAQEILKYPGTSIDYIELDPELLRISLSLVVPTDGGTTFDGRLHVLTDDARRYIKGLRGPRYDLVLLNLPEPSTANLNRLYTVEFFREAQRALKADGVIALALPASFGYVGKRMQAANGSIAASLKAVFRNVVLSSEEYGVLAASDGPIETAPARLQRRVRERDVAMAYFHPYLLDDAFDPLKVEQHRARLAAVTEQNTDARPVAYLYELLVWADMQKSGIVQALADHGQAVVLAALGVLAAAGFAVRARRQAVAYSVFLAGASSMAFSLVVLLAYQGQYGYVYERAGLLTAAFMAGSAGGAYLVQEASRPFRVLKFCEASGAVLLLLAPLFLRYEAIYLLLIALFGMVGGAVFASAVKYAGAEEAAGRAGWLYALDLAGSFLGALLTALFLVPLFGMTNTLLGMVLVKIMSLTVLVSVGHEQA